MYQITCEYCGQQLPFENMAAKPEICTNCNTFIGNLVPQNLSESQSVSEPPAAGELLGLRLTYDKTGQTIELRQFQKLILGRENFGKEVLSQVPQISRRHCSIERVNDQFVVTDEGSKNGTFVGVNRIDCKQHPGQVIHDNDLLFLGQELFLVKFIYAPSAQPAPAIAESSSPADQSRPPKYSCFTCGTRYDQPQEVCPECNSFGSVKEI